jgi:hypothetical protein
MKAVEINVRGKSMNGRNLLIFVWINIIKIIFASRGGLVKMRHAFQVPSVFGIPLHTKIVSKQIS